MDICIFFFSSRRRHTRFDCDWSSDVCSSDLKVSAVRPRQRRTRCSRACSAPAQPPRGRSEEHTSELQSQSNLVCRLLLEKKKNILDQGSQCIALLVEDHVNQQSYLAHTS